mgnify:CR=1 FL=1
MITNREESTISSAYRQDIFVLVDWFFNSPTRYRYRIFTNRPLLGMRFIFFKGLFVLRQLLPDDTLNGNIAAAKLCRAVPNATGIAQSSAPRAPWGRLTIERRLGSVPVFLAEMPSSPPRTKGVLNGNWAGKRPRQAAHEGEPRRRRPANAPNIAALPPTPYTPRCPSGHAL